MTGDDTLDESSDETIDVLLIEDNPGDARLIEEMLVDAETRLRRVDVGETKTGGANFHHEQTLAGGIEFLTERDVDVVLLDLGLPGSTGLDTLSAVTDVTEFVPIVVLTGLDDEGTGVKAIKHGAQDYLVKDEVTSHLLVRSIHYALERNRQEHERARRREQLRALNRLNRIGQDVTHAVIQTSTRDDLERAVCERLVASDGYRFAWIGEIDRVNDEITPRISAGVEDGFLDAVTVTVSDDETAQGPAGRAVRNRAVQTIQDVEDGSTDEAWRAEASARGYRSVAAIPILYEDIVYGVLNIYASTPNAFSGAETDILSRLGDVIGHAITAIERKEALVSDTVLELEFRTTDVAEELVALTADSQRAIRIENLVRAKDGLIAYGRATGVEREAFRDAASGMASVDDLRILSSGDDEYEFELVTSAVSSLVDAVATHGGRIDTATITDGSLRFVVEFPQGRDKRQLIELVEGHCPGAQTLAQRIVKRSTADVSDFHAVFQERLTEKQRTALRTAYYAGLFEWPRQSTGQEIAERLGVSPPTFNQHLRAAEQKFFDAMFEE